MSNISRQLLEKGRRMSITTNDTGNKLSKLNDYTCEFMGELSVQEKVTACMSNKSSYEGSSMCAQNGKNWEKLYI